MSYLNIRNSNGISAFSNPEYLNAATYGTRKLCVRTNTGASDIVKYGLTTDITASSYCPMKINVSNKTCYIAKTFPVNTTSSKSINSTSTVTTRTSRFTDTFTTRTSMYTGTESRLSTYITVSTSRYSDPYTVTSRYNDPYTVTSRYTDPKSSLKNVTYATGYYGKASTRSVVQNTRSYTNKYTGSTIGTNRNNMLSRLSSKLDNQMIAFFNDKVNAVMAITWDQTSNAVNVLPPGNTYSTRLSNYSAYYTGKNSAISSYTKSDHVATTGKSDTKYTRKVTRSVTIKFTESRSYNCNITYVTRTVPITSNSTVHWTVTTRTGSTGYTATTRTESTGYTATTRTGSTRYTTTATSQEPYVVSSRYTDTYTTRTSRYTDYPVYTTRSDFNTTIMSNNANI